MKKLIIALSLTLSILAGPGGGGGHITLNARQVVNIDEMIGTNLSSWNNK